ncbi:hypothetical protein EZS27_008313 [termite gut metagenome]|uniref:HTH cro/C1-type domain-containing protein n=1 Tax=termite gut metagenome TaxID=433724 RepID=A0A5J4SD87_9ZZZZ
MKKKIDRYVSDILKKKRHEKGWTQQQLADYCGLKRAFINCLENKEDRLNVHHINIISDAFGCSPKDFLPDEPILEEEIN